MTSKGETEVRPSRLSHGGPSEPPSLQADQACFPLEHAPSVARIPPLPPPLQSAFPVSPPQCEGDCRLPELKLPDAEGARGAPAEPAPANAGQYHARLQGPRDARSSGRTHGERRARCMVSGKTRSPTDAPRESSSPGALVGLWCREPELNWRHRDFQSRALPTELSRPGQHSTCRMNYRQAVFCLPGRRPDGRRLDPSGPPVGPLPSTPRTSRSPGARMLLRRLGREARPPGSRTCLARVNASRSGRSAARIPVGGQLHDQVPRMGHRAGCGSPLASCAALPPETALQERLGKA